MKSAAHLQISSETLGDVSLHLRIQDGAAHIRVEGASRSSVEARAPELARALAAEGIGVTRIEVAPRSTAESSLGSQNPDAGGGALPQNRSGGDGSSQEENPAPSRTDPGPSRSAPRTTTNAARNHGGTHDVTA
jgi:hypothetical protein